MSGINWSQILGEVLPGVVQALGILVAALIAMLANSVKKGVEAKTKNTVVLGASTFLVDIARNAVLAANQVAVDKIKNSVKDGKITKEESQLLLQEVKQEVLANVKQAVVEKYSSIFSPTTLEKVTSDAIEAEVASQKSFIKAE